MKATDIEKEKRLRDLWSKLHRGILNALRSRVNADLKQYLYERFPMLQQKKYTDGMRIYWLLNGIEDFPECACKDNGVHQNKTSRCRLSGYESPYCSKHCAHIEGNKQGKDTKAQRYGDPNWNNRAQCKETCKQKYGVENSFCIPENQKQMKQKRALRSSETMKKAWKTRKSSSAEKFAQFSYGDHQFLLFLDASPLKSFEVRSYTSEERKLLHLKIKQYAKFQTQEMKPEFTLEEWIACKDPHKQPMKWTCREGHHFEATLNKHYHKTCNLRCPVCNPYLDAGTSKKEKELQQYIMSILPGIDVQMNTRDIIKPLELDAYVPSKRVAFEFDGLYSHSALFKKPRYHCMKTSKCSKLGIQLIHVFEDEWDCKREACKSMIADALNAQPMMHASLLQAKVIEREVATSFFRQNCVLKFSEDSYCDIGLLDEAQQVLFACRFQETGASEFEIECFCSKSGISVHNGIDACMKLFTEVHQPTRVALKLDKRWYSKETFQDAASFKDAGVEKPQFYYVNYGYSNRYAPSEITSKFLAQMKVYDPCKPIDENLAANKFTKIWDAGKIAMTWERNERHVQD